MITKTSLKQCLLLMGALFIVGSASANSYFHFEFPLITDEVLGNTITIPIKASFDNPVTSWEIEFEFPEGLTPIEVTRGEDLEIYYLPTPTSSVLHQTTLFYNNEAMTHFMGITSTARQYYYDDDSGTYQYGDRVSWDTWDHDEMFLITFYVDPNFSGGDITFNSRVTCGFINDTKTPAIIDDSSIDDMRFWEADADSDGTISYSDIYTIVGFIMNNNCNNWYGSVEDGTAYLLGDVNHDGNLDLTDMEKLIDYILSGQWRTGYELDVTTSTYNVPMQDEHVNVPANINFYIDELSFTEEDLGTTITIPVKATFDSYISSWEVEFSFPEGLTPTSIVPGSDMSLTYIDSRGREKTEMATYVVSQDKTHIIANTLPYMGYQFDEDEEEYISYGSVKWDAGEYDEMFLVTFRIDDYLDSGDLIITSHATCGRDTRNEALFFWPVILNNDNYFIGDVNLDGVINISDITCIFDYLVSGQQEYGYISVASADTNQDGIINLLDIEMLTDMLYNGDWYDGYVLSEPEPNVYSLSVYYTPIQPGDMNGDERLTITDVTDLIYMLLNDGMFDNPAADVDGNGRVTINDVTELINILLNGEQ